MRVRRARYAPPMADSEYITRADVERVIEDVQTIVMAQETLLSGEEGMTQLAVSVEIYKTIEEVLQSLLIRRVTPGI